MMEHQRIQSVGCVGRDGDDPARRRRHTRFVPNPAIFRTAPAHLSRPGRLDETAHATESRCARREEPDSSQAAISRYLNAVGTKRPRSRAPVEVDTPSTLGPARDLECVRHDLGGRSNPVADHELPEVAEDHDLFPRRSPRPWLTIRRRVGRAAVRRASGAARARYWHRRRTGTRRRASRVPPSTPTSARTAVAAPPSPSKVRLSHDQESLPSSVATTISTVLIADATAASIVARPASGSSDHTKIEVPDVIPPRIS